MSGSNGTRAPLHLVEGGRSASDRRGPSELSFEERLAAQIAQGARAGGYEDLADDLGRAYLEAAAKTARRPVEDFDPIERHPDRLEDGRGGPTLPAASVFEDVLGALPSPSSTAASVSEDAPLTAAADSPQARHKPKKKRDKRDKRRPRRRKHSKERLAKLKAAIFGDQTPDVPDPPELKPEVRAANLAVVQDGTGRKACELVGRLPIGQQLAIYAGAYAAADKIRTGRSHRITREEVANAKLPDDRKALIKALEVVREEVAPSLWFRRLVCCAWALWGHRHKLTEEARKAWRGGIFTVEGFCENALRWLVPKPDGTLWSRSTLYRRNGPFALLGAETKALGRKVRNHAGMGLFTRWQPPHAVATYKGPWRTNDKTGDSERFALAQHRYDSEMSGRTAMSLARRARGKLRELARTIVAAVTPWVKLPAERKRVVQRREEAAEPADAPAMVEAQTARAPP